MADPTKEELMARIAELEKQSVSKKSGKLEFRVGAKGGVSVYGLGRFPVTLYYEQWVRLLDYGRCVALVPRGEQEPTEIEGNHVGCVENAVPSFAAISVPFKPMA
jgi:hypothetical protein